MRGEASDTIEALHAAVERAARRLHVVHATRLQCKRGCSACCEDELTVSAVEAAHIRRHHHELLAQGVPHATGACAFLDAEGACRIYGERPYVCRTQGLPLRWLPEPPSEEASELRDICPLNETSEPIETLPAEDCWTLGPTEERLAHLQIATGASPERVSLRELFARIA